MNENDNVFLDSQTVDLSNEQFNETEQENTVVDQQQEESTPEGQVDETTEEVLEEEQPLILGKFKTQDDLVKAYQNLQSSFTKVTQQLKAQPKQVEQPKQEDNSEEERLIAWYNENVATDPINANATLARYMAQKEINAYKQQVESMLNPLMQERQIEQADKTFRTKYPDHAQYDIAAELEEITQNEPELLEKLSDNDLLEKAYYRAKVKSLETKAQTAFENGKKALQKNKQDKTKVNNELNKTNIEEDTLPPGVTLVKGDGIFF